LVVPGLLGAERRVRSCLVAHESRARRRPPRGQWAQDMDQARAACRLDILSGSLAMHQMCISRILRLSMGAAPQRSNSKASACPPKIYWDTPAAVDVFALASRRPHETTTAAPRAAHAA
jgi:hypothetical protein